MGKIPDEEEFVSHLGDVNIFTVNLSEIADEEFVDLKTQMEEATRLPLPVFLYRYWREYGTLNLLRYFKFVWESYPTSEIISRFLRAVGLQRKQPRPLLKKNRVSSDRAEVPVEDVFPVS